MIPRLLLSPAVHRIGRCYREHGPGVVEYIHTSVRSLCWYYSLWLCARHFQCMSCLECKRREGLPLIAPYVQSSSRPVCQSPPFANPNEYPGTRWSAVSRSYLRRRNVHVNLTFVELCLGTNDINRPAYCNYACQYRDPAPSDHH